MMSRRSLARAPEFLSLLPIRSRAFAGLATPTRNPAFARLVDADIAHFRSVIGDASVVTDTDALAPMNSDWMKKYRAHPRSFGILLLVIAGLAPILKLSF
jgi:hypothetical protein